jgi:hypothetical protein
MSIKYSGLPSSILLAFYDEIIVYKKRKSIFRMIIKELKKRHIKTK